MVRDGTRIAFNDYAEDVPNKSANVYTIRTDGTSLRRSLSPAAPARVRQRLVARRAPDRPRHGDAVNGLYLVNADGTNTHALTHLGPKATRAIPPGEQPANVLGVDPRAGSTGEEVVEASRLLGLAARVAARLMSPSRNSSIILAVNAGMSSHFRLVTSPRSVTTCSSTVTPAFRISVLSERGAPIANTVCFDEAPRAVTDRCDRLPGSKKSATNPTIFSLCGGDRFATPPGIRSRHSQRR
jgi:hypothetical protein